MGQQPTNENVEVNVDQEAVGSSPFERLDEYKKVFETEQEMYSNVSRLFRDVFFVSEGQKIDNVVFFDNGRTKPFRSLEEHVTERVDALFETTVSDPQNDKILKEFIDEMKKKYKVVIPNEYPNRDDLDERIKELALLLCKEVKKFFDGNDLKNIDHRCEQKILEIKRNRKNNLVFLGELKGCGICRHRSILFKLLCDIFGIPCRILRGWIVFQHKSESHMWNEVIISKQRSLTIDCRNFEVFVPPRAQIGGDLITYMNLGHPQRSVEIQRMTSDSLQKLFTENDGREAETHLGELLGKPGAFGSVRELRNVNVIDENQKWVKMNLAVKEVNITQLTRYESNPKVKERLERIIKKEVDRMNLLKHPNITKIYGYFCTEMRRQKIVRVVMKKYDKNGDELLEVLETNDKINPEKREIEVCIFLMEILKGLKYIHSFGIVHFDIKPQNILLNWDEKYMTISDVVISDFGSSKDEKMNFNLTSAPTITEQFAAPEIIEMIHRKRLGFDVSDFVFSTSSDIYSFGVLMGAFLQYFSESVEKKKMMEIQSFCVHKIGEERPQIDQILDCVGKVLEKFWMMKEQREVYTWGESDSGVLGHGRKEDKQISPKLIENLISSSSDIKNLFCGEYNICVLMKNGSVLSWGSNVFGQLGSDRIGECFSSPSVELSLPRKIVQVTYNGYCILYLDCEGSVWACGNNSDGILTGKKSDGKNVTKPIEITSKTKGYSKMVKISTSTQGGSYFCCVDINGKLFTWGEGGDRGALKGHGEEGKKKQFKPTFVSYFDDIFVVDCKMGRFVTLVLTQNGKVYSFGHKNSIGRKLETKENWISTPGIIGVLEEKKITKISTYFDHCGVVDSIGDCYLWGDKGYGYSFLPKRIGEFNNKTGDVVQLEIPTKHKFVQVQCGWRRTIFLLEEKTENSKIVHHVLTEKWGIIPSVVEEFENRKVEKVCSRDEFFLVLVKGRNLKNKKGKERENMFLE